VAGNSAGVEHALASIYRASALFLTNKENMVAATGHFEGTELNSDRLIGSVAANLATVYRVLFGMRFEPDRLVFRPFVPRPYERPRTLRGLRYRNAELTVTVRGFGNGARRVLLDGRPVPRAEIPSTLSGAHTLEIEMNGVMHEASINVVADRDAPETPVARSRVRVSSRAERTGSRLTWGPVAGARSYVVYRNGIAGTRTTETSMPLLLGPALAEYQVLAVDSSGLRSFLSEPVRVVQERTVRIVEAETGDGVGEPGDRTESRFAGFSGAGYRRLSVERDTSVLLRVTILETGTYSIDVRYANGSGPINSSDKAAIRSLYVDDVRVGALVMPQRGTDLWNDWGYSNPIRVKLSAGEHRVRLLLTSSDVNMNGTVNEALLDHVRLTHLP
jgi:hypothetical protein